MAKNMKATNPELTLLNTRWGYDGGGFACGPIEGNTLVELMVHDENGRSYFILAARMDIDEKIYISEYPLYDIMLHTASFSADFDHELAKCEKVCREDYDFDLSDLSEFPEGLEDSRFYPGIQLAHFMMTRVYDEIDPEEKAANEFAAEYLNQDLMKADIPEITFDPDEDDYEDDDEDENEDE